jgi:hypothetical protein
MTQAIDSPALQKVEVAFAVVINQPGAQTFGHYELRALRDEHHGVTVNFSWAQWGRGDVVRLIHGSIIQKGWDYCRGFSDQA